MGLPPVCVDSAKKRFRGLQSSPAPERDCPHHAEPPRMLRNLFSGKGSGEQVSEALIQDVSFGFARLAFEAEELGGDITAGVRAQGVYEGPVSVLIAPLRGNLPGSPDDDHDGEKCFLSCGKVCRLDSWKYGKHRSDLLCEDLVILGESLVVAHFRNKHFDKHRSLLSHEPAGPLERTLLAGPGEVWEETLPVDGLKYLLDPPRQPPVVACFLVEIHLLKTRLFRLDQYVVSDERAVLICPKTELVERVGIHQSVELVFSLAVGEAFRGSLQLGNNQVSVIVGFDQIDLSDERVFKFLASVRIVERYGEGIFDDFDFAGSDLFVEHPEQRDP